MNTTESSRKRQREDIDPDAYMGSEEDGNDEIDVRPYGRPAEKRSKRDRSGGGGLQTFTRYVCLKLEEEREMTNTDIAEILVKEHSEGETKKNDNIRRRVYDALSVINAIGLAEKKGKTYIWVGRPTLPATTDSEPIAQKLQKIYADKRLMLIRLIRRAVGLEYLKQLSTTRGPNPAASLPVPEVQSVATHDLRSSSRAAEAQRADEIGEFELPILVLSTDNSAKMLMETDASSNEVGDSVLTELGYDDINKLDKEVAHRLLRTFISLKIPRDIIEEALNIQLSEHVLDGSNSLETAQQSPTVNKPLSGFNAIMNAAQRLESASQTSPSGPTSTYTEPDNNNKSEVMTI